MRTEVPWETTKGNAAKELGNIRKKSALAPERGKVSRKGTQGQPAAIIGLSTGSSLGCKPSRNYRGGEHAT